MFGSLLSAIDTFASIALPLAQQGAGIIPPALTVVLCAVAAIGTILLLPARFNTSLRTIGGIILAAAGGILAAILMRTTHQTGHGQMGIYFWVFAAVALLGAVRVITHTKPVYSALYFVLTVMATAGLFVLMWAEFMAIALIIIYAGAILVTYVFVIMLAAEAAPPKPVGMGSHDSGAIAGITEHDQVSREPIAATAVCFVLLAVLLCLIFDSSGWHQSRADTEWNIQAEEQGSTIQALGVYLFNYQIVSLELAGLILTLAMVGAIVIARRRVIGAAPVTEREPEMLTAPMTPVDDNPHAIPVYGTDNPRQKAYPET